MTTFDYKLSPQAMKAIQAALNELLSRPITPPRDPQESE